MLLAMKIKSGIVVDFGFKMDSEEEVLYGDAS